MTRTAYTLDDLGEGLSEVALLNFCQHLPATSELFKELYPEEAKDADWQNNAILPQLVATLIDELRVFQWMFAQSKSKRNIKNKFPEPIKRPGITDKTKKYGKDPIPVSDFKSWYEGGE